MNGQRSLRFSPGSFLCFALPLFLWACQGTSGDQGHLLEGESIEVARFEDAPEHTPRFARAIVRLRELVENGFFERAKAELAGLAQTEEDPALVRVLERWDRYVDGRMLDQRLEISTRVRGPAASAVGRELTLDFEILNPGPQAFTILASCDFDEIQSDEHTTLRVRVTQVFLDPLGGRKSTVTWLGGELEYDLVCFPGELTSMPYPLRLDHDAPYALALTRFEVMIYPCAALFSGHQVPLQPIALGSRVVRLYPENWKQLAEDPLASLKLACISEDPVFDRHAVLAASLLEDPDHLREAFDFLSLIVSEGAPRSRAKATAALDYLRLDRDSLWAEVERFLPEGRDRPALQLPTHR